ncbi:MAG: transposase [Tepidisphaeraceae bacterium]
MTTFPKKHDPKIKRRALAMLRAGKKTQTEIAEILGIPSQTISTWNARAKAGKPVTKPKAKPTSATSYLAKQLEIVSKMLRAKLPELAKFTLVTDENGDSTVEYTVRQLQEISGSVKL